LLSDLPQVPAGVDPAGVAEPVQTKPAPVTDYSQPMPNMDLAYNQAGF
jgi:hypothetical protein